MIFRLITKDIDKPKIILFLIPYLIFKYCLFIIKINLKVFSELRYSLLSSKIVNENVKYIIDTYLILKGIVYVLIEIVFCLM